MATTLDHTRAFVAGATALSGRMKQVHQAADRLLYEGREAGPGRFEFKKFALRMGIDRVVDVDRLGEAVVHLNAAIAQLDGWILQAKQNRGEATCLMLDLARSDAGRAEEAFGQATSKSWLRTPILDIEQLCNDVMQGLERKAGLLASMPVQGYA
jgi:hypothetical protein